MNICLTTAAKEANAKQVALEILERLPVQLVMPCKLTCTFNVQQRSNYFVVNMETHGTAEVTCQRCLQTFVHDYHHESQLAICRDDHVAEELLQEFECIVSKNYQLDLVEVLTDELHLFLPEKHAVRAECDEQMQQYIQS